MQKTRKPKKPRGLAAMSEKRRMKIASQGGKSVLTKYGVEHFRELGRTGGTNKAKNAR